jgi:hypothetical protein
VALLARFACGCKLRVEIPAPAQVRCAEHGAVAVLIQMANGQVRYTPVSDQEAHRSDRETSSAGQVTAHDAPMSVNRL